MVVISGALVALSFIAGIIKVSKISLINMVLLAVMAGVGFAAPEFITSIAILDSFFVLLFAVMKGFAIGGITRLFVQFIIVKATK